MNLHNSTQWSVSQSANLEGQTSSVNQRPSPNNQDVINLTASIPIRRYPDALIHASMWKYYDYKNQIVECDKAYYSNSIIITSVI